MAGKTLAHLMLRLGLDTREFRAGMTSTMKKMKNFERATQKLGNTMTAAITVPTVMAGAKLVQLGIDAQEGANLVQVSFGTMTDSAIKWSENLQETLGYNKFAAQQNAAMMHTMIKSMGLSEEEAYKMATSLVELSGDMKSFYNLASDDAAFEKLRAGIVGEAEPLKQLGILINDTTIKQAAYEAGIASVGSELTETQKVQARYLAIMKATQTAQGDLSRTQDSAANQLRAMQNELTSAATELGVAFLPIVKEAIPVIRSAADSIIELMQGFQNLSPQTQSLIIKSIALSAALGPLIRIVSSLTGVAGGVTKAIRGWSWQAHKLGKATTAASTAAQGFATSSARLPGILHSVGAKALVAKAGLVALAAVAGYKLGEAMRPAVEGMLGLDDAAFKTANTLKDFTNELAGDEKVYNETLRRYNMLREKLEITDSWMVVGTEHTRANAAVLAELYPKVLAMSAAKAKQGQAQQTANTHTERAVEVQEELTEKLDKTVNTTEKVGNKLADMYGVMTKDDASKQMQQLATDFQELAAQGVSTDQLMAAFGDKVASLSETAGGYKDLKIPQEFKDLKTAMDKGQSSVDTLAKSMANKIPAGANAAKSGAQQLADQFGENGEIQKRLSGGFGTGIEKGVDYGRQKLDEWATELQTKEITVNFNVDDFKRKLADMGMEPDGPGATP